MDEQQLTDLYTDYLICSTRQTTATGLSSITEGVLSNSPYAQTTKASKNRTVKNNCRSINQYNPIEIMISIAFLCIIAISQTIASFHLVFQLTLSYVLRIRN
ncbi:hypothetical protein FACS1894152_7380 [Bacilli bacterium]|nr:hypothetical protein FACS1894152_7380 [Bacilli bacterium]